MILPVHEQLRARLAALLSHQYGLAPADQPAIAVDYAPSRALGDLAVPVAFELARRLRKAPRVIAQELAAALGQVEGFARIDAAPNGYLNAFLDRRAFLLARLDPNAPAAAPSDEGKTIVEHTAINPNKAAHIGHLRNAALGDTLVRVLRFRGVPVEVQNYIDDTGVQVADVVVGFRTLERKSIDEVRALAAQPSDREPFGAPVPQADLVRELARVPLDTTSVAAVCFAHGWVLEDWSETGSHVTARVSPKTP